MSQRPIGVFDSGLGGLTTVKELKNILPNENIVYFGDTERVPYGTRSKETIIKYARQDINFLIKNNVKIIISACGTVSSVASVLTNSAKALNNTLYTGVVLPAAQAAAKATKNLKVGVLGTAATINSHSYKQKLNRINSSIKVYEKSCPLFVPLVENGIIDPKDQITALTVERYLKPLKEKNVDTIILGCTHYPLLSKAIKEYVGENVNLVDSGKETAIYASKLLRNHNLINDSDKKGNCSFYVSDSTHGFANMASMFLGEDLNNKVTEIDIDKF